MEVRDKFLERIGELKTLNDMGNYPFELRAGLANGTLNRLSKNGRPTLDMVVKISKGFNVTTDYLLGLEEYSVKKYDLNNLPFIKTDNIIMNHSDDPINKYVPWAVAEDLPNDFFDVKDEETEKGNPLYKSDKKFLESYCFKDEEEGCTYYLIGKYEKVSDDVKKKVFFYWYSDFFSIELLEKDSERLEIFFEYLHKKFLKEQRKITMNKSKR